MAWPPRCEDPTEPILGKIFFSIKLPAMVSRSYYRAVGLDEKNNFRIPKPFSHSSPVSLFLHPLNSCTRALPPAAFHHQLTTLLSRITTASTDAATEHSHYCFSFFFFIPLHNHCTTNATAVTLPFFFFLPFPASLYSSFSFASPFLFFFLSPMVLQTPPSTLRHCRFRP